ncbi:methyltransferase [Enhygromyxa salina]|uniref:Methyltransferase small domain-containing protein n=1 Tax=Enhygromyxa salina TaxID=215803 RepID=A0A2S9YLS5_9BACT|nr:hypothetical protein ENSA7_42700 [Enhygromyxa salina]
MFDQYYTPAHVARDLIRPLSGLDARVCVDTSCGDGALLAAAESAYPNTQCVGIDYNSLTIRRLRRAHPEWVLSRGDVLAATSFVRCRAMETARHCDLLLLNPPFSENGKRSHVHRTIDGQEIRCSKAMKHILTSLDAVMPTKAVAAVVPESLCFSLLDSAARRYLSTKIELVNRSEVSHNTFNGARARSLIISAVIRVPDSDRFIQKEAPSRDSSRLDVAGVEVVRGGLPCFEAKTSIHGLPYIHTTELAILATRATAAAFSSMRRVSPVGRGTIRGWTILLPRVGVPRLDYIRPVFARGKVQLSDCVIGITLKTRQMAEVWASRIRTRGGELVELYRGTGARYITISRLDNWLRSLDTQREAITRSEETIW